MDTAETAIQQLAADPERRQRLALTLTPEDVSPRVGEVLVLQLASTPLPDVEYETHPLHIGIELNERFPAGYVFTALREVYGDAVGLIPCEAADQTAAMYTNADGPITDPEIALTVYSAITYAGPTLQTAIARAMRTSEVPMENTDGTHPAPGAIAVAGSVGTDQRENTERDIIPTLSTCLDFIITADIGDTLWLDGATTEWPDPVEPALASAYLHHARQLAPTIDTVAGEHLETYYESVVITARYGSGDTPVPSRAAASNTVERLAIASARLELVETVTPAHVETAVRLYASALEDCSLDVSAIEYWRVCAGSPIDAFGRATGMYTHIIDEVFDRHAEPVSMAAIHDVAAEYDVDAETIEEFVESDRAEGVYETMSDDVDDSDGPYFGRV